MGGGAADRTGARGEYVEAPYKVRQKRGLWPGDLAEIAAAL